MVQALGATVAHCIAHPGLAQQLSQVMNRHELSSCGMLGTRNTEQLSELQLLVPSWIQAALKTVINCVFVYFRYTY